MKRTPLRARLTDHSGEPGYRAWKQSAWGFCQVCGSSGLLLRHHVVLEQHVRAFGGNPWDLRNAILVGYYACRCHRDHHSAVRRLPISCLPDEALAFTVDLLGEQQAADYLRRYYAP